MKQSRSQFSGAARKAPSIDELLKSKVSMLGGDGKLPVGYGMLETDYEVREHVFSQTPDERVVRMTLVWDLPADALEEVEPVLDHMRERGAAMIVSAEEVKR